LLTNLLVTQLAGGLATLLAGGEVMAAGERVAGGDEKAAKI
jgi:hypothetical protein